MQTQTTTTNPIRFTAVRTPLGGLSSTLPPAPEGDKELLLHAVAAFGHLIPRGTKVSGPEFAQRIRNVYSHPRATQIADTLEKY
jgi:hypothetical protein